MGRGDSPARCDAWLRLARTRKKGENAGQVEPKPFQLGLAVSYLGFLLDVSRGACLKRKKKIQPRPRSGRATARARATTTPHHLSASGRPLRPTAVDGLGGRFRLWRMSTRCARPTKLNLAKRKAL